MENRENPELTADDAKALQERQESLVSSDDVTRLIDLFTSRAGLETRVHLMDGSVLRVVNVVWGRDDGDDHAHGSTNVSPSLDDSQTYPFEFFFTYQVVRVIDPQSNRTLYESSAAEH